MSEYVTCPLHGAIPKDHDCGASPEDHLCRTDYTDPDAGDQMTSWRTTVSELCSRMKALVDMHSPAKSGSGTTGYCAVCDSTWPCWTWHVALGFDNYSECEEAGWCEHAKEKI